MSLAITLHVLATIVWVGGMFFAHMALRPVAVSLFEPPQRLPLFTRVFGKFFPWVWVSILLLWGTGFWMTQMVFGGLANVAWHITSMFAISVLMTLIFMYIYFQPYQKLRGAVRSEDWPAAGKQLVKIRQLVATNLVLGLVTSAIGTGGKYISGSF